MGFKTQLLLVAGLSILIGAALVVAGTTAHNATQPGRVLPFGLDAYLGEKTVETLSYLKYRFLIVKEIEENGHKVQLDWSSMESLWRTLHEKYQPFYIFMVFYSFMTFSYIWSGAIFIVVEQYGWLQDYKIQQTKLNPMVNYVTCILNILFNYVIVIIPMIIAGWPIFNLLGFRYEGAWPTWWELTWQMCFFFVGEDWFEYWGHRWLHIPWLYQKIHKVHHEFQAPFGLSASYAHWAEIIILGAATFAPPVIARPHLFTFYVWIQLRQLDAVVTHCGYNLPFNVFDYLPYYGGTKFHDYHHTSFFFNYASRFTWIDKAFGTYRDPDFQAKPKSD